MPQSAKFISIEGIEGVGKSTLLQGIDAYLTEKNIPHVLTREPGGTMLAERMREILLNPHGETVTDNAELLLMFAARSQHIDNKIRPSLSEGKWVVSDRFTDASYAYQGGGRQFDVDKIAVLEQWVHAGLQPDVTLLLDAPVDLALSRAKKRSAPDRIEAETADFFERVRHEYLKRAAAFPERFVIIDAQQDVDTVSNMMQHALNKLIEQ